MSEVKVACIQFSPVNGEMGQNIQQLERLFARVDGADLVVLPELASTGYWFSSREEAFLLSESVEQSRYVDFLEQTAAQYGCYIVSGFLEREEQLLYNSSILVSPEGLGGVYRKLHLFDREKDIFEPGDLGMPVYETPIGTIGMLVCYDWMFPEVWRKMTLAGAQIIAHPCNLVLPYAQKVVPAHALINRIFVATANRVGTEHELHFTGESVIVNPKGELLARASVADEEIVSCRIDLQLAMDKQVTPRNHVLRDRRVELY